MRDDGQYLHGGGGAVAVELCVERIVEGIDGERLCVDVVSLLRLACSECVVALLLLGLERARLLRQVSGEVEQITSGLHLGTLTSSDCRERARTLRAA